MNLDKLVDQCIQDLKKNPQTDSMEYVLKLYFQSVIEATQAELEYEKWAEWAEALDDPSLPQPEDFK